MSFEVLELLENNEEAFMMSMLLSSSATVDIVTIDEDTSKVMTDDFEIYIKSNKVYLVIDTRNPMKKTIYNNLQAAYTKVFT